MSSPHDHVLSTRSFTSDNFRLINKFKKFQLINPNYEMPISSALLVYIQCNSSLKPAFYVHCNT